MYFLKSRYYDPETGRFISPDGIEYADPETINGLNLYAYCGNNPVMNIDPEGHLAIVFPVYYLIVALLSIIATATVIYVENETHIIQNAVGSFVNMIKVFGERIVTTTLNSTISFKTKLERANS